MQKTQEQQKDDVDYDSFIDLHNKEESARSGIAQLQSVDEIKSVENVPDEFLDHIDYAIDENFLHFTAEVIDHEKTHHIEIYVLKNNLNLDIIKDWTNTDYIKNLPLKNVPIKHIKNDIYTIPDFKEYRNSGIEIEQLEELHKNDYIQYNPREKSWDVVEFDLKDKLINSVSDKFGGWLFATTYITISLYLVNPFLSLLGASLVIGVFYTYYKLLTDNIPRYKLDNITHR